ncbi:hypothetical protein DCS_07530 [Drechmeria coniospora]|uniref:Uncharacterized protein n=1 Tax=Drechmeria coniospora TaxID=98403 RepID=A0A151GEP2_DRECN|nr:hypothetical protein DCS_07530 [Drechmeria coniospora]KYK55567.1 hypothetical protein DCS_07530 [Drechmeria coniospora]
MSFRCRSSSATSAASPRPALMAPGGQPDGTLAQRWAQAPFHVTTAADDDRGRQHAAWGRSGGGEQHALPISAWAGRKRGAGAGEAGEASPGGSVLQPPSGPVRAGTDAHTCA